MAAGAYGPSFTFEQANRAKYGAQARLFLNAFWPEHQADAPKIFDLHNGWIAMDLHLKGLRPPNPAAEGVEVEENGFHYFLEKNLEPLTVMAARAALREADVSKNNRVSYLEFLLWHFKKTAAEFDRRRPVDPMGSDDTSKLTPAMRAAKQALNDVRNEIQKIESEKFRLETDAEAGGIKGIKAKNELAQLLARDPTDLNRALLTAEAAVRKAGGSTVDLPPSSIWWMNYELESLKKYARR